MPPKHRVSTVTRPGTMENKDQYNVTFTGDASRVQLTIARCKRAYRQSVFASSRVCGTLLSVQHRVNVKRLLKRVTFRKRTLRFVSTKVIHTHVAAAASLVCSVRVYVRVFCTALFRGAPNVACAWLTAFVAKTLSCSAVVVFFLSVG